MFVSSLAYVYNVQVQQITNLPHFGFSRTRYPAKTVRLALPVLPAVGRSNSALAYRLHIIHRATILGKMQSRTTRRRRHGTQRTMIRTSDLGYALQHPTTYSMNAIYQWQLLRTESPSKKIWSSYFSAQNHMKLSALDPFMGSSTKTVFEISYISSE